MPFVSLFWQEEIAFVKLNWVLYPILIAGIVLFVFARGALNWAVVVFLAASIFYLALFIVRSGDLEGFFRFFVSTLPFLFLPYFKRQKSRPIKTFFVLYILFFLPAVYMAYLQFTGQLPYYDFDYVDGQPVGRMSGGYSKPMNFIAYLTPLYILGIYLIVVAKRRFLGVILVIVSLYLVYLIGHRTSLAAFVLMFAAIFFKKAIFSSIYTYYKYYLNFIVGVLSFLFFYFLKMKAGLVDAVRGRIAMWQAHAEEFFQSDAFSVVFGIQNVELPGHYAGNPLVVRLDEVHNNSYRTIILFGLAGFFIYCTFMRWIVLSSYHAQPDRDKKFIIFACFIYFILYTITNEPFYYGSVVWPLLLWIFILRSHPEKLSHD